VFQCGGKQLKCTGTYKLSIHILDSEIIFLPTFRVALPFSGIKDLSNDPIKVVRNIGIYSKDADRTKLLIQELEKLFVDGKMKHQ